MQIQNPRGRCVQGESTPDMDSTTNRLPSVSNRYETENVRETAWRIHFAALVEVRITRGTRTLDIGIEEMVIGPNDERVSFDDAVVSFIGNERTCIHMVVRLPTGALRIAWESNSLRIDDRYRLSAEGFTSWPCPEDLRTRRAPILYVELFGRRATRVAIEHAANEYMVRCEPDFPAVVMEMEQYSQLALSLLRDFELDIRDRRQSRTRRQLRRLRRRATGRIQPYAPISPGAITDSGRSNRTCESCAARNESISE